MLGKGSVVKLYWLADTTTLRIYRTKFDNIEIQTISIFANPMAEKLGEYVNKLGKAVNEFLKAYHEAAKYVSPAKALSAHINALEEHIKKLHKALDGVQDERHKLRLQREVESYEHKITELRSRLAVWEPHAESAKKKMRMALADITAYAEKIELSLD